MSYPANTYPTNIQTPADPTALDDTAVFDHAGLESFQNDSIVALKTKLGINGSTDTNSIEYKLAQQIANGVTNSSLATTLTAYLLSSTAASTYVPFTDVGLSGTPVSPTNKLVDNVYLASVLPSSFTATAGESISVGGYLAYWSARNSINYDNYATATISAGGSGGTFSITDTITIGSNSNRILFFSLHGSYPNGAPTIVTVSSTAGTVVSLGSNNWYILNPNSGSQTITISGTWSFYSVLTLSTQSYYNVNQVAPTSFTSGSTIATQGSLIFSTTNSATIGGGGYQIVVDGNKISGLSYATTRMQTGTKIKHSTNTYYILQVLSDSEAILDKSYSYVSDYDYQWSYQTNTNSNVNDIFGDSGVIQTSGVTPNLTGGSGTTAFLLTPANTFTYELYNANSLPSQNSFDGNKNNFVGVSTNAVSAGGTVNFNYPLTIGGLSSLVLGKSYYINDSGNLSLTQGTNTVLLGIAITSTVIGR